jgi:maltoporin
VYVTGYYSSTSAVTLNNNISLPISVGFDAFIVKYNTSGLAQWATTISGTGNDYGFSITTDATGVYVTGQYSSTSAVTLNNGKTLPISVGVDAFIVKYNTSGLAQLATTISGIGSDTGQGITADATGVYVTGYYSSTTQILLTNGS